MLLITSQCLPNRKIFDDCLVQAVGSRPFRMFCLLLSLYTSLSSNRNQNRT